jgi:hypothetical protein
MGAAPFPLHWLSSKADTGLYFYQMVNFCGMKFLHSLAKKWAAKANDVVSGASLAFQARLARV